jgi:hypothetical protein
MRIGQRKPNQIRHRKMKTRQGSVPWQRLEQTTWTWELGRCAWPSSSRLAADLRYEIIEHGRGKGEKSKKYRVMQSVTRRGSWNELRTFVAYCNEIEDAKRAAREHFATTTVAPAQDPA